MIPKNISTDILIVHIKDCKILREHYKKIINKHKSVISSCHLCATAKSIKEKNNDNNASLCTYCPWSYFSTILCMEFMRLKFGTARANTLRNRHIAWAKLRIPMLNKWIERLEVELQLKEGK
jgi:hypothetical protein